MALSLTTFTNSPSSINTLYSFNVGSFNGGDTRENLNLSLGITYNNRWNECRVTLYANSTILVSNKDTYGIGSISYNLSSNTSLTLKYKINVLYDSDGVTSISPRDTMSVVASLGTNSLVSKNLGSISLGNKNLNIGYYSYGYYSFTPTKTGSYTLTSPTNISGNISTSNSNTNTTGGNTITMKLTAGTTYYITFRNVRDSNYDAVTGTATLSYNPPISHINYVYNGQNTIVNKEEDSFPLTSISDLGYTLNGWNFEGWTDTLSSFEVKYKNSATFTPIEGTTEYYLYPIWSKFFTINYKYGYPTSTIESEKAYMYSYETTTDIEDPTATSTYSQTFANYTVKTITETFTYDDRLFSPEVWYIGTTNNYIQMGNKNFPISSNMNLNLAYSSSNLSLLFDGNDEKVQGSTSNITTIPQRYYCSTETFQVMAVAAPECGFSLSGKKFKEWNSSPDGKGTSYKVGDLIQLSTNTTVYAIWINADEPFIFLSNKQVKPYLFKNNKYYEIKFM